MQCNLLYVLYCARSLELSAFSLLLAHIHVTGYSVHKTLQCQQSKILTQLTLASSSYSSHAAAAAAAVSSAQAAVIVPAAASAQAAAAAAAELQHKTSDGH